MNKKPVLLSVILLYAAFNLVSLSFFPFMHSDEGWLASLSRSILVERNIGATEDFFHEIVRNPHAIKTIFHLLQIPFISTGFSLFSVRFFSLIAGFITLFFLFKSFLYLFHDKLIAFVFILLIALDIQFIYISHFARQEILILLIFSICLYIFIKPGEAWHFKKDLIIGSIIGLSIGIHPNVFIIAVGFIFLYLFQSIVHSITKNPQYPSFSNLGVLILILVSFGIVYIGLSLKMNSTFISAYLNFGEGVGVTKPFIIKVLKLPRFYRKMFSRIGGTYYLPDIRPQLVLFAAAFLALIPVAFVLPKKRIPILSIQVLVLGINTGILIIGKYSPPSIIFIFIPGYFLLFFLIKTICSRQKIILFSLIFAVGSAVFTTSQILPWMEFDYNNYIREIKNTIPENSKTLANINSIFAFSYKTLYSYRDLTSLNSEFRFSDYIKKHKIEYIVYSDELKIIFEERPVWNTMYGNIYPWYEDMMGFLHNECEEIATWNEPVFGMRITGYMGKRGGDITIYRVLYKEVISPIDQEPTIQR